MDYFLPGLRGSIFSVGQHLQRLLHLSSSSRAAEPPATFQYVLGWFLRRCLSPALPGKGEEQHPLRPPFQGRVKSIPFDGLAGVEEVLEGSALSLQGSQI